MVQKSSSCEEVRRMFGIVPKKIEFEIRFVARELIDSMRVRLGQLVHKWTTNTGVFDGFQGNAQRAEHAELKIEMERV